MSMTAGIALDPALAADVAAIARITAVPDVLRMVTRTTGMRFAAVARVTDTTWTACAVHDQIDFGLQPGGQLALESTICNEIRQTRQPVVFGHASADPDFRDHPTPRLYGFESYISLPIVRSDGSFFGTLCALDPRPTQLDDPGIVTTLELFAELIGKQLELEDQLTVSERSLLDAREDARTVDQFVAVLGHDLRNPLHAIGMGAELLARTPLSETGQRHVERIGRSVERMNDLVQDILDLARGRLGGGIAVDIRPDLDLADALRQVVSEVAIVHPGTDILSRIDIGRPVACDVRRIAQLVGNLISNAVHHGSAAQPVQVHAHCDERGFELSVSNGGAPIPAAMRARLFEPYVRAPDQGPQLGLGLGLYIASEIAKAHGGTLVLASSDDVATVFVLRLPLLSSSAAPHGLAHQTRSSGTAKRA